MKTDTLVTIHNSNELSQVLLDNPILLVLVCKNNYETFHGQLEIIKGIGKTLYQTLKVGLVAEEFAASFCGKYQVKGTPTFLFFIDGQEQDRILGCMDRDTLVERINQTIQSFKDRSAHP